MLLKILFSSTSSEQSVNQLQGRIITRVITSFVQQICEQILCLILIKIELVLFIDIALYPAIILTIHMQMQNNKCGEQTLWDYYNNNIVVGCNFSPLFSSWNSVCHPLDLCEYISMFVYFEYWSIGLLREVRTILKTKISKVF